MQKKYIIYGLIALVVCGIIGFGIYANVPQSTLPGTTCYAETDSGYDIYNKGTVTFTVGGGTDTKTDYCINDNTLKEFNCEDHPYYISYDVVSCSCSNGVCVNDKCNGVVCRDKCNGDTKLYRGECNIATGECEYSSRVCDYGCENSHCISVECEEDIDCNSDGEICVNNECVLKPECTDDSDCDSTQKCLDNQCVNNYQCVIDKNCELDEECINNVCTEKLECEFDIDCGSNEKCVDNICTSYVCEEGQITDYYECSNGERIPNCLCSDNLELCLESPETQCKKDWKTAIIISIIVIIIMLMLIYSLIPRKKG